MKPIYELEMSKEPTGENILVVDALNLAFRYKHQNRLNFRDDYKKTVHSLAKSYQASNIILACDWGKSSYRKEIYPEYKADREKKVAEQTEDEKQAFLDFFEEFEKTLDYCSDSFTLLRYKGVEADDIAAYLTHYYLKDYGDDIWLVSSDKDWDLLLKTNVHRFSYVTRKEYSIFNWQEHYSYPFKKALDIKVLVGGKDNVLGIPGIGEKRALKLLEEYDNVWNIYINAPIPGKAVYINNLNNNLERILLNMYLIDKITYCEEAIGEQNIADIKEKLSGLCT